MSNIKITQLPVATSLTGAEVVPLVQSGGTVQVAVSVFVDYLQDPGYFRAFPGTVSVVSYSFKDTPNTGIYSPATGQLGLVTAGAERLLIDSSGNVGIGTSSPLAKLEVAGGVRSRGDGSEGGQIELNNPDNATLGGIFDVGAADTPRLFSIRNNMAMQIGQLGGTGGYVSLFTAAAERLRVDASGNVGIGTSSPAAKLEVANGNNNLRISRNNDSTQANYISGVGQGGVNQFYIGYLGADTNLAISNLTASPIVFSAGGAERLRIDPSGNVRVGMAALATTATDGFLYVPTCPGTPTGVPTAITGLAPIVINSTNNKLYFYSGGAWRDAGP